MKQFDKAVEKVTNSILVRGNPFLSEIRDTLHNFTSRQLALPEVCKRLLSSFDHAQEGPIEFREQQFVTKSMQLIDTIKKLSTKAGHFSQGNQQC